MKTKHTGGEWRVSCPVLGTLMIADDSGDVDIAEVLNPYPRKGEDGSAEAAYERKRANAYLIAAAPDMLKALKLALDCLQLVSHSNMAVISVRAAIAKAKGL